MSVDVVLGAQFGSEGKGKICAYLGLVGDYTGSIRTGGPNAGHTVLHDGRRYVFRHIPSAAVNKALDLIIGPGSYLRLDVFEAEVRSLSSLGISHRLAIDRLAGVISPQHVAANATMTTPSMGQGVAPASADRALRKLTCVRDSPLPHGVVVDILEHVVPRLDVANFLLEGTQGFALGYYQDWYPHSTSRDISVAALLSEATLPLNGVRDVYGVFRTFPIRTVDGQSDLDAKETTWPALSRFARASEQIEEHSSVDGSIRRVARLSVGLARRFIRINRPTVACITFADYLDAAARGITKRDELPSRVRAFLDRFEDLLEIKVGIISTGPHCHDVVDLR
jgi:adenylosuccinate synthase